MSKFLWDPVLNWLKDYYDALTATAAELNILDGCTASTAELNKLDGCTATVDELNLTDAMAASVGMTPAAGGANVCEVTFQVKDAAGASLAGVFNMDIWLSDAATGDGLTGSTASGAVAAKASSGTDLVTMVSKKALRVQTKADGSYILSITDTGKTGFYPCASLPSTGKAVVGSQLITGNYG